VTAARAFRFGSYGGRTAFGTEFGVADFESANTEIRLFWLFRRLYRVWRRGNRTRAHINSRNIIGLLRLFVKLLAHRVGFCLRVCRRQFFLVTRRAAFALIGGVVPANFGSNPFSTARALMKMLFAFFDRRLKRGVMRRTAGRALDFVSRISGGMSPAEQIARCVQKRTSHADIRRLKFRHKAVAAFIAMELELKTLIR